MVGKKYTYQSIGNSVVLSTSQENNLSNNSNNKIDGDGLSEVVQRTPVKKKSSSLHSFQKENVIKLTYNVNNAIKNMGKTKFHID